MTVETILMKTELVALYSELLVRLADGPDSLSGRVELRQNGIWGTVCDDDFGPEEATVICRMLNLNGPAQPAKSGSFGPGKGPIWLDELGCSGTENTLMECARLPWAKHNCRHTEDAGKLPEEKTESDHVSSLTDLVQLGTLPVKCDIRMVEDNPSDPLLIQPKVVKGEPTKPGAYPWQVGVRVRNSGKSDNHWCGATIISENFILTAAHCPTSTEISIGYPMDVRADPVGCPSWTSHGCLKDILMSSPVDVQLGISMDVQKNGRLWYQLKIWEKLKDLTSSGIEPGTLG
ncbi:hypothetical protein DAPPUDRAFT_254629 [Daphnia pulex]|uniref:SRCR domain-containing protein n=1 Tax=Daphnia pulex TaxID=6669 RepID=E9H7H4_DAPPU|nr:hypothetical protein DAPPUDRAFT_254629 [Daphnia pulex]|eukprot:EFX72191.1 hypothetical protein DAPPUDRAFT_254629 [Daphnia pulex]